MERFTKSFRIVKPKPKTSVAGKKKRSDRQAKSEMDTHKSERATRKKHGKENKKDGDTKTEKEEPGPTEREKDHDKDDKGGDDIEDAKGVAIPAYFQDKTEAQMQAFEKFAKQIFAQGVDGVLKEYNEQLKSYVGQPSARVIFDKNMPKNRYKDVICNDLTRVAIKDGGPSDYIHANFVRGEPLFNEYICTQGPIVATRDDFWRMIVYLKVERIVMLCEVMENGKLKCDQYWPAKKEEKMTFGDITVENVTALAMVGSKSVVTTKLHVTQKSSDRTLTVFHHHWKTWPDRSIPKSSKDVLRVLRAIRFSGRPAVIHCSAGIGRTGTLVAIEMAIQAILSTCDLNMIAVCKRLRDQRMGVLQVDVQYVYMALAVIDFGMSMGFLGKSFKESPFLGDFAKFKKALDVVLAQRMAEASALPPPSNACGSKDPCQGEKPCAKGDCPKPVEAVGSDDKIKPRTQDEKSKEVK